MSVQIEWILIHKASNGTSRGILGRFSSREAALEAGAAETEEWPFAAITALACDLPGSPQPLRGQVWEAKHGGVKQSMMVAPQEVQP